MFLDCLMGRRIQNILNEKTKKKKKQKKRKKKKKKKQVLVECLSDILIASESIKQQRAHRSNGPQISKFRLDNNTCCV
jgi:ATP-dependent protease HslVU (ClpYQ) ATPase subunit